MSPGDFPDFDVFRSYSAGGRGLANQLNSELRRRDISVWIDHEQIPPGGDFLSGISQAIANSTHALILFGKNPPRYCLEEEIELVLRRCSQKEITPIPVLLPGVEKIPPLDGAEDLPGLATRNHVQFVEDMSDVEVIDRLARAITGRRPAAGPGHDEIRVEVPRLEPCCFISSPFPLSDTQPIFDALTRAVEKVKLSIASCALANRDDWRVGSPQMTATTGWSSFSEKPGSRHVAVGFFSTSRSERSDSVALAAFSAVVS